MKGGHWALGTRHRGRRGLAVLLVALVCAGSACAKRQLEGQSNSIAVVDGIFGANGAKPTEFSGTLASDVLTFMKKTINNQQVCVATIFEDSGRATMHLALKDPGSVEFPTFPSPANTITFTRYRLNYRRADGRSEPGVDVPYPIDGAMTISLVGGNVSIGQLTLVRAQAKQEAPLKALVGNGGRISIATIGELTFYGSDQTGRAVVAEGFINITFSDWADPDC
jgi:hypothetical protein